MNSTFRETLPATGVKLEILYQNCKTYTLIHDNITVFSGTLCEIFDFEESTCQKKKDIYHLFGSKNGGLSRKVTKI